MALPAVNRMAVGTSTATASAVPRAAVPAAIRNTVTANQPSKESSAASRTIVKQRGIANQRPGERRGANQRTTEDKVQAVVTQTDVKRQGSAKQRPGRHRSTDQYPNVGERSPVTHATPVPAG